MTPTAPAPKIIIPADIHNLCASGRFSLHSRSGDHVWINQKELPEIIRHNFLSYRYVGTEHGVGIYKEV